MGWNRLVWGLASTLVLGLLLRAGPARGLDKIEEIDRQWVACELHEKSGDLGRLKMTLDFIDQELKRRVQLGFLHDGDAYLTHHRAKLAAKRRWLEPQLPFYEKLVTAADRLAKKSWNLGLFQGGQERFETYAKLRADLDVAETLSIAFVDAFPAAMESPPIKKIAAARKNLDDEQKRATASWLRQATELFELALARDEAAPPAVAIFLLQTRAIDPKNAELTTLITRLSTYHQKRYRDLARRPRLPHLFPESDQASLARFKQALKATYARKNPTTSIRRFTLPETPSVWVDAKSRAEAQTLPALLGVQGSDGRCDLLRVWYLTTRAPGAKAFTPFQISGIEKLSPLDCSTFE